MNNAEQIIKKIKNEILKLAKENNWLWFYKLHQTEVVKSAEILIPYYPDADKDVILLACWLHDISQYTSKTPEDRMRVKLSHHLDSAEIAAKILKDSGTNDKTINKITRCIERHRNSEDHRPETIEEKIVAVADTYSHFISIFYLTYFKFHPDHSIEDMVRLDKEKLERDWRDLQIIPEAAELAKNKYEVLKEMLESYSLN